MNDKEKAKDKRLRKTYGITLEQYNAILEFQGGRCAICGRLPKNAPLQVDHVHFKVEASPSACGNWYAWTRANGQYIHAIQATKKDAIQVVKDRAIPYSVRGLLCPGRQWGCNRLLGRVDNLSWLLSAHRYLTDLPARKVLDKSTPV